MCMKEVVEDIGVSLNMKYFENLKKYALGPFSLPRPLGIFHCACVTLNSTFSVTFLKYKVFVKGNRHGDVLLGLNPVVFFKHLAMRRSINNSWVP